MVIHECTGPWAIGYLWTGDPVFLQRTRGRLNLLERDSLQPFGVNMGDEEVGLTSAFRGTETCDVVQYMWNYIWLLRIGGEGQWGDRVERAFSTPPPPPSRADFKTHVYYQSPNRISATPARRTTPQEPEPLQLSRHAPAQVLHVQSAPHVAQLRDAHVDGHLRQRSGGDALWAVYGQCAWSAIACRSRSGARPPTRSRRRLW